MTRGIWKLPVAGLTATVLLFGCGDDQDSACEDLADLAEDVQEGQSPTGDETLRELRGIAEQAVDEDGAVAQAAQGVLMDLDTFSESGGEDRLAGTLTNMMDACGL